MYALSAAALRVRVFLGDLRALEARELRLLTFIGQVVACGCLEVALAMLAIADAMPRPTVGEDTVHRVHLHDFARDAGHIFKVVWPQRGGDPQVGVGPMAHRLAIRPHHNPVGVGVVDILMDGVGVGAGNHIHAQPAAPLIKFAKGVAVAHPGGAIVVGDLGRIVGDAATGAETGGVAMRLFKEVQPEIYVIVDGVGLGQCQLRPAHGAVKPILFGWCGDHLWLLFGSGL